MVAAGAGPEAVRGQVLDMGRAPATCSHGVLCGERTGQKRPSVQSTEQRGRWLDPAPGWCSSAACVCSPGWHEAPGTSPALRLGGQETRGK
ncbi:uncharacterized protein LOC106730891 isoform X6 [Camelus ferus]|uniref:Uncharacterized protein LOC106730891 isoform X6 n=1 Tax=Camelus ferus TaxID=419612 RepID=A0A8B8SYP8_CAMFR|nr:uncharacterized protein LOC106730891 isoform X6 [Camelus ferus]